MDSFEESCRKHPFHTLMGVCPFCLSHRLRQLCTECAVVRPCGCPSSSVETASDSSSSSSSFASIFDPPPVVGISVIGRISVLIDSEPALRRSTSARIASIPFLRSKSRANHPRVEEPIQKQPESRRRRSIWSFLTREKQRKEEQTPPATEGIESMKFHRSRSAGISYFPGSFRSKVEVAAESGRVLGEGPGTGKSWVWSFPTPRRVFRQTRAVDGTSPMYRG